MTGAKVLVVALILSGLLLVMLSRADEPSDSNAAKADPANLTWPSAKTATAKYQDAVKSAEAEFRKRIAAAGAQYARQLDDALKDATRAGNLDEALKIRAVRDAVTADAPVRKDQLVIYFATFGGAENWTDVTTALRKHIQQNTLTIVPTGPTFGVGDPAFGQWKGLFVVYGVGDRIFMYLGTDNRKVTLPAKDEGLVKPAHTP